MNKEVHERIKKNMKESKVTLENMFRGSESLEVTVGDSECLYNEYGKDKKAWYRIYKLIDEKNDRVVIIVIGESAEIGKSYADDFKKLMEKLKHNLK